MIKISKVEIQKKHDKRVSIFVDDEYYASMLMDTCIKYGIKKDLEIDENVLHNYIFESEKQNALNKAMNYINTSYKTTKQVRDYLNKKGYDKSVIEFVILKLKEYNFLDDKKYAEVYVQTYSKKYGINMLKTKLFERGIHKDIVDECLKEFSSNNETIDSFLLKKINGKPLSQDLLTKCIRFLTGKGFKYDEIKSAISRYKENSGEEIDESWD